MKFALTFLFFTLVIAAPLLAKAKIKVEIDSEGQKFFVFKEEVRASKISPPKGHMVKERVPSQRYILQMEVTGDDNSKIPQIDVFVNKFWLARVSSLKKETKDITEFLTVGYNKVFFMVRQISKQTAKNKPGPDAKVMIKLGPALALKSSETNSVSAVVEFLYDGSKKGTWSRSYDINVQ